MKNKVFGLVLIFLCCSLPLAAVDTKKGNLKADYLRYKKDERIYLAEGNVILDYDHNLITSLKLKMNKDTQILIAEDDVELNTEKQGKPLKIRSQYLKLWAKDNNMLALNQVLVDYDKQEIKSEKLTYIADEEKIIVEDNVEIREDKQKLKADQAMIYLEEGDFDATGNVELEFEIKEDK